MDTHTPRPDARGPGAPLSLLSWRRRLLLAAALGAPVLTGCVVAPVEPRPVSYSEPYYVNTAPPPAQYEQVGPPPAVGYVWIGGYWAWQLSRYVWIGGHWEAPRAGHHWQPHAWYRGDRGWYPRYGRWERR